MLCRLESIYRRCAVWNSYVDAVPFEIHMHGLRSLESAQYRREKVFAPAACEWRTARSIGSDGESCLNGYVYASSTHSEADSIQPRSWCVSPAVVSSLSDCRLMPTPPSSIPRGLFWPPHVPSHAREKHGAWCGSITPPNPRRASKPLG